MKKQKLKKEIIELMKWVYWEPIGQAFSNEHPIPSSDKREFSKEVLKKIDSILEQ